MLMDGLPQRPETYPERFEALMLMAVADHQSLLNHEKKRNLSEDLLVISWTYELEMSGAEYADDPNMSCLKVRVNDQRLEHHIQPWMSVDGC